MKDKFLRYAPPVAILLGIGWLLFMTIAFIFLGDWMRLWIVVVFGWFLLAFGLWPWRHHIWRYVLSEDS